MRLVIGVSRLTSAAGKPLRRVSRDHLSPFAKLERTDVARQDQEIVVGETAVPLRINEGVDVDAIVLSIVLLQNLQGGGVVEHLSRRGTVDGGHFGRKKEGSLVV